MISHQALYFKMKKTNTGNTHKKQLFWTLKLVLQSNFSEICTGQDEMQVRRDPQKNIQSNRGLVVYEQPFQVGRPDLQQTAFWAQIMFLVFKSGIFA